MTQSHIRRPVVLLLALVGLLALGGATANATARAVADPGDDARATFPPPSLTGASATFRASDTLMVTGVDFTPGGKVEVAIYDEGGTELLETRFVTATATVYGRDVNDDPNDPTTGFTRAGVISAAFDPACGSTAQVRAYDQQTARWSDWLALAPDC